MKQNDIRVGRTYTDGKGNDRLVVAAGSEYRLFDGQADADCLRYKLVAKKRSGYRLGEEKNTTRRSFAAWAKAEVMS